MTPSLQSSIAGIPLESCLMNASGVHCTREEELQDLIQSDTAALVTKSCTLEYREGNPEPRYASIPHGSINSMGLPNMGIRYYLKFIEEQQKTTSKPLILSLAGLSKKENLELLKLAGNAESLSLIELNLSCPNVPGKPQTAYDFEETKILLEEAFSICRKPLGVKLPPYFDMAHFEGMAEILSQFPLAYVCCVNSLGNGLWVNSETESVVIKPKAGFGGVGGLFIKATALANVRMFSKLLPETDIVGCGGVETGEDAFQLILCGASLVQIGTCLWEEGTAAFGRISEELKTIMQQKGYQSIADFKGQLKEL
jgi:dihydroorotate dehydrogenase (fumarate)